MTEVVCPSEVFLNPTIRGALPTCTSAENDAAGGIGVGAGDGVTTTVAAAGREVVGEGVGVWMGVDVGKAVFAAANVGGGNAVVAAPESRSNSAVGVVDGVTSDWVQATKARNAITAVPAIRLISFIYDTPVIESGFDAQPAVSASLTQCPDVSC